MFMCAPASTGLSLLVNWPFISMTHSAVLLATALCERSRLKGRFSGAQQPLLEITVMSANLSSVSLPSNHG